MTLDIGTIVERLGAQLGVDVADKLPPDAAEIKLLESDQLSTAQEVVNALKDLSLILPLIALALYALAIYLARGWRREAVRAWGISWMLIGVLVLIIRSVAGDVVVGSLARTDSVEPAVAAVWDIATSLLRNGGIAMFFYGLVILLGAVLAGPLGFAKSARRSLTPLLRERGIAYATAAFIVLLLLWWGPTEGFRRPLVLIVLLALFVVGIEALRAQVLREYPDETWDDLRERWSAATLDGPGRPAAVRCIGGAPRQRPRRPGSASSSASSPCATPAPSTPRSSPARSPGCLAE